LPKRLDIPSETDSGDRGSGDNAPSSSASSPDLPQLNVTSIYNNNDFIRESQLIKQPISPARIVQTPIPPRQTNYISLNLDSPSPELSPNRNQTAPISSKPIEIPKKILMNRHSPIIIDKDDDDSTEEMPPQQGSSNSTDLKNVPPFLFPLPNKTPLPKRLPVVQRPLFVKQIPLKTPPPQEKEPSTTSDSYTDTSLEIFEIISEEAVQNYTGYFVVPNIRIYQFLQNVKNILQTSNESQKNAVFAQMAQQLIYRTIKKDPTVNPQFSLETFTESLIDVNTLCEEHEPFFLTSRDPHLITSFLKHGLSLKNQIKLFQETLEETSPGFLNNCLAHMLILYGDTIPLLQDFYNSKRLNRRDSNIKTIPSITELEGANSSQLKQLEDALLSFNPLIIRNNLITKRLGDITEDKIVNLICFYNDNMTTNFELCTIVSEQTRATQYSRMTLNPTDQQYDSMSANALSRYLKANQ
jgi:hypothetical protein